jgi:hypothetical protein
MEIPKGYCQCGCGEKTNLTESNNKNRNLVKGQPRKFIEGHSPRNQGRGEDSRMWKGGRYETQGYIKIHAPDHPRADANRRVFEHILIAEKALGKFLPDKAAVHHYTPEQLVVCQDNAYHKLLHQRQRAYEACGHAGWRKCRYCKRYDEPHKMYIRGKESYHRSCRTAHFCQQRRDQKETI